MPNHRHGLFFTVMFCSFTLFSFIGWQTKSGYLQQFHVQPFENLAFDESKDDNFRKDYIPSNHDLADQTETIHICLTIGGKSAASESRFLLRSILLHSRRSDVFFHFIVTDDAKTVISRIMLEFNYPAVNITYEFIRFDPKFILEKTKAINVRITHHSGVFGMSKSFMYQILENVDRCIVLDTDVVFGTDPFFLWNHFNDLKSPYIAMLKLGKNDNDMCSGVMLQMFSEMRKLNMEWLFQSSIPKFCTPTNTSTGVEYICMYGDQSMFYSVHLTSPALKDLEDSWTLELCHDFRGHTFRSWRETNSLFFGIVHFNCMKMKRNVNTIDEFMIKFYDTKLGNYIGFLGNLEAGKIMIGNGQTKHLDRSKS